MNRIHAAATLVAMLIALAMPAVAQEAQLVAEGAEPQLLADGFRFTEGPAADAAGNVYFTDIPNNRIHKWDVAEGKLSTFRENSGGANGLFFNKDGVLYACEGANNRVTAIDMQGNVKTLADSFNEQKFNRPNDLWIDPHGGVYFTDPAYGMQAGDIRQGGEHVYYIAPLTGKVTRVADDYQRPNGILGTADGRRLYITDRGAGRTFVYDIVGPGMIANKRLFCLEGSDGMTLDEHGNLYITPPAAAIHVYNPDGKQIAKIALPKTPANICFGGKEHDTLYITARDSFYAVKMKVKGEKLPVQGKAAEGPEVGDDAAQLASLNWYYDLNTKKLFAAYADQIPPIPTSSGKHKLPDGAMVDAGVKAYVFACGDCSNPEKRFIGYLEMYTPQTKAEMEEFMAKAAQLEEGEALDPNAYLLYEEGQIQGRLIKGEKDEHWVKVESDAAAMITNKLSQACPRGNKDTRLRPCFPALGE